MNKTLSHDVQSKICHVELILYSPLHFHLPDLQFHANSKGVSLKSTDLTRKKMSTVPHLAFFFSEPKEVTSSLKKDKF